MEQTYFTVSVTCDGTEVNLPEGAPERFLSHDDAQDYLGKVKDLLEDSAFGIHIDLLPSGWIGHQSQSGMTVMWKGRVHEYSAPAVPEPITN